MLSTLKEETGSVIGDGSFQMFPGKEEEEHQRDSWVLNWRVSHLYLWDLHKADLTLETLCETRPAQGKGIEANRKQMSTLAKSVADVSLFSSPLVMEKNS